MLKRILWAKNGFIMSLYILILINIAFDIYLILRFCYIKNI